MLNQTLCAKRNLFRLARRSPGMLGMVATGFMVGSLLPVGCSDTPIEPTPTPGNTPTLSPTASPSLTPTSSPTSSPTPSATPTVSPTVSPTVTLTPTITPEITNPPTQTPPPDFPVVELSDYSLDFGSVLIGTQGDASLTIFNWGTGTLYFGLSFTPESSTAFSYDDQNLLDTVGPSDSVAVPLYFAPLEEGVDNATLQITSNDEDSPLIEVPLTGTGVAPTPDDLDGDGSPTSLDCNDADPNTYPGAPERCDGVDNDCDGLDEDYEIPVMYADVDGDGHGDPASPYTPDLLVCEVLPGYAITADDCNDNNATIYVGATELCDELDNNCNGLIDEDVKSTFYADVDGDGHGDLTNPVQACAAGNGIVASSDDCNDNAASIYPTAPELCDQLDNDCDESIDEDLPLNVYYGDTDGDGYGDSLDPVSACGPQEGIAAADGDCNDDNPTVYPGAVEACDGLDNDCAGDVDEDGSSLYFTDLDQDGYGDPTTGEITCAPDANQISNGADCNDANPEIHPGAFEVCDAKDNNCDGGIDEGVTSTFYADADSDGYGNAQSTASGCTAPSGYVSDATDCNDSDNSIHPGQAESCNGRDDNCNSQADEGVTTTFYADQDKDGHGNVNQPSQACAAGNGLVANSDDCNDTDATIYPGNAETCDAKDNDCDSQIDEGVKTTYYQDLDGDGFGNPANSTQACAAPVDYVTSGTDCNDKNQDIYPGAQELCNSRDDNCNGQIDENVTSVIYKDADGDTYGDPNIKLDTCSIQAGYVTRAGDCNDQNPAINPGAAEVCNQLDDNCNAQIDENVKITYYQDLDSDTYGNNAQTSQACSAPAGYVSRGNDCNDLNNTVYPGASERCDSLDNDCNGKVDDGVGTTWYQDADGDAFGNASVSVQSCNQPTGYTVNNLDCNDTKSSINPNATEVCNGFDDDCDTQVDENVKTTFYQDLDLDGYGNSTVSTQSCTKPDGYSTNNLDCKDTNDQVYPGATEVGNGLDDDCDGQVDEGVFGASCKAIKAANPSALSGVYAIDPDGVNTGNAAFDVYCDMVTDGGGWIVFQRRQNGSVDFYRTWAEYAAGFGNLTGEHWLGNDKIALISRTVASTLRVDMKRYTGATYYAYYSNFGLGDSSTNYKLSVAGFSGTAPDCCGGGSGMYYHNNMVFSTKDRNNTSCATSYKGAWWYNGCHYNNLNGYYYGGPHSTYADGVNWYGVTGYYEALIFSEMKMR